MIAIAALLQGALAVLAAEADVNIKIVEPAQEGQQMPHVEGTSVQGNGGKGIEYILSSD